MTHPEDTTGAHRDRAALWLRQEELYINTLKFLHAPHAKMSQPSGIYSINSVWGLHERVIKVEKITASRNTKMSGRGMDAYMSTDTDTVARLIKPSMPNVSYICRDTSGEMRRSWWSRQHIRRVHDAVRETMGEPGGQVRNDTVTTCSSCQIITEERKNRNISPHGMV